MDSGRRAFLGALIGSAAGTATTLVAVKWDPFGLFSTKEETIDEAVNTVSIDNELKLPHAPREELFSGHIPYKTYRKTYSLSKAICPSTDAVFSEKSDDHAWQVIRSVKNQMNAEAYEALIGSIERGISYEYVLNADRTPRAAKLTLEGKGIYRGKYDSTVPFVWKMSFETDALARLQRIHYNEESLIKTQSFKIDFEMTDDNIEGLPPKGIDLPGSSLKDMQYFYESFLNAIVEVEKQKKY